MRKRAVSEKKFPSKSVTTYCTPCLLYSFLITTTIRLSAQRCGVPNPTEVANASLLWEWMVYNAAIEKYAEHRGFIKSTFIDN